MLMTQKTAKQERTLTQTVSHAIFDPIARVIPRFITPNYITLFRAFLIPFIVVLLIHNMHVAAFALYLVAVSSDGIDGALARLRNSETRFGAILDPVIDKLLHTAVLLVFFSYSPILISITVGLDTALTLGGIPVLLTRKKSQIMKSNNLGKWKFFFQASALMLLFITHVFDVQVIIAVQAALICAIIFSTLSICMYIRNVLKHKHS